jgi:hypothetical protein
MTQRFKLAFLALLAGGASFFTATARADEYDKETTLTFNEPVEIPGHVLQAGSYVFKLADGESNRNIVQVFTHDQKNLIATVLALPDSRLEPADNTIVTFEERPSGSPEAVHSWFYPGDTEGFEFAYPDSEERLAAKSSVSSPTRQSQATKEQAD